MDNNNNKWDKRFLRLAIEVSTWSQDPSTRVGAVITDILGRVVGTGFNGFPRGVRDTVERLLDRDKKLKFTCHAEQNAIWLAGEKAQGGSIYIYPSLGSPPCCHECAKAIIQAGIIEVIGFIANAEDRWTDSMDVAREMLEEAGVKIVEVEY